MGKWREKEEKEEDIKYILSLDGGGMRGIIPIYIIDKLSEKLRELGDERPFYSHFDLIAGTSTGSLIALSLAIDTKKTSLKKERGKDYRVYKTKTIKKLFKTIEVKEPIGEIERSADPKSILSLYKNEGPNIFRSNDVLKRIIGPIIGDKYDGIGLDDFLKRTYKEARMEDMLTPTMAVAFDPYTSKPFIFRSWEDSYFLVRDAARASSSAPTYFPPARVMDLKRKELLILVDGGIAANNPVLLAYREARRLYPKTKVFRILSLSTGSPFYSFDPMGSVGGAAGWASSIWQSYGSGSMRVADMTAEAIDGVEYLRIWDPMKEKIKLDDTSEDAMNRLEKSAETMLKKHEIGLSSFLRALKESPLREKLRLREVQES